MICGIHTMNIACKICRLFSENISNKNVCEITNTIPCLWTSFHHLGDFLGNWIPYQNNQKKKTRIQISIKKGKIFKFMANFRWFQIDRKDTYTFFLYSFQWIPTESSPIKIQDFFDNANIDEIVYEKLIEKCPKDKI